MPNNTQQNTNEEWLPILGWEDTYEVSNLGRVRSLPRVVQHSNGRTLHLSGRILRPGTSKGRDKYLRVGLCRDGELNMKKVHLLVAEAFIGPRPKGAVCRHLNDDPSDNRVENLRWGTASENQQDSVRNKHHCQSKKTHCKRGHPLSGRNLTRSRPGRRDCAACFRARKSLNRRFGGYTEAQIQQLSDEKYSAIMQ